MDVIVRLGLRSDFGLGVSVSVRFWFEGVSISCRFFQHGNTQTLQMNMMIVHHHHVYLLKDNHNIMVSNSKYSNEKDMLRLSFGFSKRLI